MPLTIPPFTQYQAPLFPLRGLWNTPPIEGDRFISAEIDWGSMGGPSYAIQFALSGNSPVAFSQIVALSVDNARCGGDCQFVFPDSGYVLQVPARAQGVYPVFTNGLMFYAVGVGAFGGDVTAIYVHNSMPPPVQVLAASSQSSSTTTGIVLANGTTALTGPISGTLTGFNIVVNYTAGASASGVSLSLTAPGQTLWSGSVEAQASTSGTQTFSQSDMSMRTGAVSLVIANNTMAGGSVTVNLYYSVP